jgi:hypothetical protein
MRPEKPETAPLYYAIRLGFRDLAEHLLVENPEHVSARGGFQVTPFPELPEMGPPTLV